MYSYRDNGMYSNDYYNYYGNFNNQSMNQYIYSEDEERFFLTPFLVGGLAGTALGLGVANNNQLNSNNNAPTYYPIYPVYPMFPTYSNNNYYY